MNNDRIFYVVGACFDMSQEGVVLIKKNRPYKLCGRWNFPGGKLEPLEISATAMQREFLQETGLNIESRDWHKVINFTCPTHTLEFFVTYHFNACHARTTTDEEVQYVRFDRLKNYNLVPDIDFYLPILQAARFAEKSGIYLPINIDGK